MNMPESPPQTGDDVSSQFWRQLEATLLPLEDDYLHWEHLCQKPIPIQNVNHKQWWQLLKAKRRARRQLLPFSDKVGKEFYWVFDDRLMKKLSQLDRMLGLQLNSQLRDTPQANAFIDEAIRSAQLANSNIMGASAQDLLCAGVPSANTLDHNVLNYYNALHNFTRQEKLTISKLQEMANLLYGGQIFLPLADQQKERLQHVCDFANQDADAFEHFMHPILKAVILHFMLINDEIFTETSASMARLIFYWQLLTAGYTAMQSITVSAQLQEKFAMYQRAFLFSYTDDNDLTYVIMQQLDMLLQAINAFTSQLGESETLTMLTDKKLNVRQAFIVKEMQQYPQRQYRIATIQRRFKTTYETARTDLFGLVQIGLAKQGKMGKAFVYSFHSSQKSI